MEKETKKKNLHIIKCGSPEEFQIAAEFAKKEEWNSPFDLLKQMTTIDTEGFFLGLQYNPETINFETVSCISAMNYGPDLGYIGLYIVREDKRSQGLGYPIFKTAMDYLKNCQTIGLDSCPSCDTLYARSGFKTEALSSRLKLTLTPEVLKQLSEIKNEGYIVKDIDESIYNELNAYDKDVTGVDRSRFLASWAKQNDNTFSKYITDKNGKLLGYAVLKKGVMHGFKLGPLFADNLEATEVLFAEMTKCLKEGESITLDVVDKHPQALEYFTKKIPTSACFDFIWMFTNGFPKGMKLDKMFIRTNDDFGL